MSKDSIDRAKENADNAVAYLKEGEKDKLIHDKADAKANEKKTKADTDNMVDFVKANENANVAKLKADKSKVGEERRADYVKADVNANVEKANSNTRRYKKYADADAERSKTLSKR
jgi:hypothetical protein